MAFYILTFAIEGVIAKMVMHDLDLILKVKHVYINISDMVRASIKLYGPTFVN